jgi:hypothetical protein
MAVEAGSSDNRQVVEVTWDRDVVTGDAVQLHCMNPDNGDVSNSGISQNDGRGYVSFPPGYSGKCVITVIDGSQNEDTGTISVDGESAETVPPTEGEDPPQIWGPNDPRPDVPIELPPWMEAGGPPPVIELPPDFWTGNLPPAAQPVDR